MAFVVAQLRAIFAFFSDCLSVFQSIDFFLVEVRFFRFEGFGLFARYFGRIRPAGEKPAGQRTTGAARSGSARG